MRSFYQKGATMWTTLTVGLLLAFVAYLVVILVNVYLDHSIVRGSMQEIVNQREFQQMTSKQILDSMNKRMRIDNIRDFDKSAFTVAREKSGEKYIIIKYSKKVHVMSNISAVVDFNEEIRSRNR